MLTTSDLPTGILLAKPARFVFVPLLFFACTSAAFAQGDAVTAAVPSTVRAPTESGARSTNEAKSEPVAGSDAGDGPWESRGLSPKQRRDWERHGFGAERAQQWSAAGFVPIEAKEWANKDFSASEAREWRDALARDDSLMSRVDMTDPLVWKRAGFTPDERAAWWAAGFNFDDAIILRQEGMSAREAAMRGKDKLRQISTRDAGTGVLPSFETQKPAGGTLSNPDTLRLLVFILSGMVGMLLLAVGVLVHRQRATGRDVATGYAMGTAGRTCPYCGGTNVRMSRKSRSGSAAGLFRDVYRCRACGRHFSKISYGRAAVVTLLAACGVVVLIVPLAGLFWLLWS